MGFFSPYKRHANQFSYKPRFYDPDKEAREQRRAELRGERSDDSSEYTPGKYIRAKREAREAKRVQQDKRKSNGGMVKFITMALLAILLFFIVMVIVPRLGAIFEMATGDSSAAAKTEKVEEGEFYPYAPFVIVPNDYVEGDELIIE
jgi:hypothetical protein